MDAETPRAATAVAFEFPAGDPAAALSSAPVKVPKRIRKRLLEASRGGSPPSSVEEIEAKLKEADLRRQQFHEWLSSKARPKPRSPSWSNSSQEEDPAQRLEAKLCAAEQKRLSLLAKAQMRLAKLDELRQAAKTSVEIRYEKEREELGTRVESRVQQAEANRMRILKDHMQRRAAVQERKARSLIQRTARENRYRECVRSAILQKRIAAEKKRMKLLEEGKSRVHARAVLVNQAAKTVFSQRENERRKLKEQLESRLQKAKRLRAEYMRQKGSPQSSRTAWNQQEDCLSRKIAKCWRRFVKYKKTTTYLAKSYDDLGINTKSIMSMPYESLEDKIRSDATLQAAQVLLNRLETHFIISQLSSSSTPENIDYLLKRVGSPRKMTSGRTTRMTRGTTKKIASREPTQHEKKKLGRYPANVVLCSYMIMGHPDAIFNARGEPEAALRESSSRFIKEFEELVRIILDCRPTKKPNSELPRQSKFKSQLSAFDAAWRSYLYCFVSWKVKDQRAMEDSIVETACLLELSMMHTCKLTSEGQTCDLNDDQRSIQQQTTKDHEKMRERIWLISGSAGVRRMEAALSDTRSKYFEAKNNGTPSAGSVNQVALESPAQPMESVTERAATSSGKATRVVRSLFGDKTQDSGAGSSKSCGKKLPTENEVMVNEIIHGGQSTLVDREEAGIKAKVKEAMEKAFWDGVVDSMKQGTPDYSRVLDLVKEVRDELCGMAPQNWKQEILDSIDMGILSQLLKSGSQDTQYLGRILEYTLLMVQKLSAPAKEAEMKKEHYKLLTELMAIAESDCKEKESFIVATVKGLRFALEEIQVLKTEISKTRIQMLEPVLKGSAGVEYLQNSFADRHGPALRAAESLPLTGQWISSLVRSSEEEWIEHNLSVSRMPTSQGLPVGAALRTGGVIPLARRDTPPRDSGDEENLECTGEKLDLLLRVGLLKLASGVEGLTPERAPETMELNVRRLRSVQGQLQQIIVTSTSLLVLRQILLMENPPLSASALDNTLSGSCKRLSELLDSTPDVGLKEIINAVAGPDPGLQAKKELIAGTLMKSLQSGDRVFAKVSWAIYLAARAIVLGGSGENGRRLAEAALRPIGSAALLDQVVKAAKVLITVAVVSARVHGPWYKFLI